MSFHNLDEEDFGSDDSSDEDYVPCEVGNQVSEEENSGEDEFLSLPDGDEEDGKRGKKRKKVVTKRNKKQKVSAREEIAPAEEETTEKVEVENGGASEESNKKRVDMLWADFLKDVEGPTKNSKEGSTEATTTTSSQKSEKVTIVKEYDFAGETVRISTQVDASSKEAKEEEKQKSLCPPVTPQPQVAPSTSTPSPSFGLKKPAAGLSGLLDKLQKKPKMTILEKSKLDWSNFKDKEGIGEELQQHIRGKKGYLEKKAFLERADYRQFEIERDVRLAVRKAT